MEFEVDSSRAGPWAVVSARGELDLYTVALLKDELGPIVESESLLVFDFTKLDYIDSTAVGVVVSALLTMRKKGGAVRLACSQNVRKVFESAGLHKQIDVYDSLDEATRPSS